MFVFFLLFVLITPSYPYFGLGGTIGEWIAEHVFHINYDPNQYQAIEKIWDEALLDTSELIQKFGYNSEVHDVKTTDGYTLRVHRIPYGQHGFHRGLPVLLMHGFFASSEQWVDNRYDSLGFILADEGFDVWLGNLRGNWYSEHENFTFESREFWDFSLDQHAQYDLSATIDYILQITQHSQLIYVGYSLGSTVGFALLSSNEDYNYKVAGFVALAPIASLTYTTSLLFLPQLRHYRTIQEGYDLDNQLYYHHFNEISLMVRLKSCPSSDPYLCEFAFAVMGGYECGLRNKTRMPIFMSHISSGTSVRNAAHFGQIFKHKKFAWYNHGRVGNLLRYKRPYPELYDVSKISTPIALYHGANDAIANPIDVEILSWKIQKLAAKELIRDARASHSALVWLLNSKELLYSKVVHMVFRMCQASYN